ncbi:class II 3-deoxy-7-phosphoheptulonate synthase [Desulfurivibrio alkaliphilus]|uniref:Phospho-2-dehydro-3-deoxyheptonate aldolase n=1 Tax=Desulfurivibrio alkaliphilus (strain DSM 19089 / UNIQEM U267 / AHT2) TaxID=589865 RepID=D6Z546_DESAT|nr:3-deoxy-7-phosphoheptulonate synthase class II [Desulfurivibrio alkaliphilus]ADH86671.1 phospho-2-dehydro-3-deoxyheptonate aldolase [Desulfurivibrio alkaliphilus AHT 2]
MSERSNWSKDSWHSFKALQQPNWPDGQELQSALATISELPPLVFAGEIRDLKQQLAKVARGEAFLLQGGDCAESFSYCTAPAVRELLKVILQMTVILGYAGGKPVVKVGRMAGQYAKPRSADTEMVDGVELPSYRGDMVNSSEPNPEARRPDPQRMVKGYFLSCATMNILRAFTRGGYAALDRVHAWNNEFVKNSPQGQMYERLASHIEQAINFMRVVGLDTNMPQLTQASFFTSHEALLLGYEEALTRQDSTTGDWYDCSAHMLWIGERTRQVDGAHVEFFRGVHNPIGVKIGPSHDIDDVKRLVSTLNPDNEPGKLTLITRFGIKKIAEGLTPLVQALKKEGFNLVWSCDPMHGNTYTSSTGLKTRNFINILEEIRAFFEIHWQEGTVPGGVHFEMTGADVTECVGGGREIMDQQLSRNYQTMCDPRLNAEQSLELAFQIAEMLREK